MINGDASLWTYSCITCDWTKTGDWNLIGSNGGHVTSVVYDGKTCTLFWCEESTKFKNEKLSYSVCSANLPRGKTLE